jgi:mediator of RNA polymerase II transcription subunit 14
LHALLRQGRLADALPALVSVLRDTVPILEVLARIPARAVPKAAGWWRVMFGPRGNTGGGAPDATRHALDFRVLTGSRIAMFDASESLFRCAQMPQPQQAQVQQRDAQSGSPGAPVGFRPIPGFGRAVDDAVKAGRGRGTVAGIKIGVVCGAADVVVVGEALWASVARACWLGGDSRGDEMVVVKMEEGD